MIGIGFDVARKLSTIDAYVAEHGIEHVVELSPRRFTLQLAGVDHVEYASIIEYVHYYRLIQEVDANTLIIINECLRTQNRYDLTYNCIRRYLLQTNHVLVFQSAPLIDTIQDFGVLFDFVTKSRWKHKRFENLPLADAKVVLAPKNYGLEATIVEADARTRKRYTKAKRELIDNIGLRDPHTIPRNLHLFGGKTRAAAMCSGQTCVARNARFKSPHVVTYRTVSGPADVLDFPHNFTDYASFLALSGQDSVKAIVSDLPVDLWYLKRYQEWCKRANDGQASLLR